MLTFWSTESLVSDDTTSTPLNVPLMMIATHGAAEKKIAIIAIFRSAYDDRLGNASQLDIIYLLCIVHAPLAGRSMCS